MSSYSHTNPYFAGGADRINPASVDPTLFLAHRCRLITGQSGTIWNFPNIDHVHVWVDPNTAFVLVIKGGRPLMLEEPAGVFPSDDLVAKFKLMMA